ncbi:MAG: hypothetical protein GX192_02180 [Clostridiales bacterium]|nr:hypothetical protein [Clostridiales bacterium]
MTDTSANIEDIRNDALSEINNIGAGNAATAMSAFLGQPIRQSIPKVFRVPLSDMANALGGAEKVVVAGLIEMSSDVSGFLVVIQDISQADRIVEIVTGAAPANTDKLSISRYSDFEVSLLSETVNIICGSYITAISTFTGLKIGASIPYLCVDMIGSVVSATAAEIGKTGDFALIFESELYNADERVSGKLILIPDQESCNSIMASIGVI